MGNTPTSRLLDRGRLVLAVASPREAEAVLEALGRSLAFDPDAWSLQPIHDRADLLVTGVGKVNSAGAIARLLDGGSHGAVVSVGVAGALPASGLGTGSVVAATESVYADEGLVSPDGFVDVAAMGFPPLFDGGCRFGADPDVLGAVREFSDVEGPIATVSTCSGTDASAREIERRTGALCEAMEGAAVVQTAHRLAVAAGELRVISNTTGERGRQSWDLDGALATLGSVIGRLLG